MTEKRQSYHHGGLRQALVDGAIELIETQGLEQLSLRRVATRLGVSQSALYSHFRDKRELLDAVAAVGFECLRAQLYAALRGGDDATARSAAVAHAYLMFALARRDLFRLMFRPRHVNGVQDAALDRAATDCILLIEDSLREVPQTASSSAPRLQSTLSWALIHGLAELLLTGRVKPQELGFNGEQALLGVLFARSPVSAVAGADAG